MKISVKQKKVGKIDGQDIPLDFYGVYNLWNSDNSIRFRSDGSWQNQKNSPSHGNRRVPKEVDGRSMEKMNNPGKGQEFTDPTWERFHLLAGRAGAFMALFIECQPYIEEFGSSGWMDPETAKKVDYCLRGMEHFGPLLEKFKAFMTAMDETPMELVDPEILSFLDSL